ncbi:hypothetical protein BKA66DRAFT_566350 [Pyrenochaeta sp. MPI-SDFR-AT-0127]|nr:hypothetical protein BKA66DRAFT_566350 [Pyrenochaeta sp. MPI-SDFR-AT-0127]
MLFMLSSRGSCALVAITFLAPTPSAEVLLPTTLFLQALKFKLVTDTLFALQHQVAETFGSCSRHKMSLANVQLTLRKVRWIKEEIATLDLQCIEAIEIYFPLIPPAHEFRRNKIRHLSRRRNALNKEARLQLDTFLAHQCLELCEQMHQLLPRELRDMIYMYILGNHLRTMCASGNSKRMTRKIWKPSDGPDTDFYWMSKFKKLGILHICNVKYVGMMTVRELAETCYCTSILILDNYDKYSPLPKSSKEHELVDQWGLNLDVPSLIKSVELETTIHELTRRPKLVRRELAVILHVKKAISVTVRLSLFALPKESIPKLARGISNIFPILDQLVKAGHMVFVLVGLKYQIEVKCEELMHDLWLERFEDNFATMLASLEGGLD